MRLILFSVEAPSDVAAFAHTSKNMLALAIDADLMARWLLKYRQASGGAHALSIAARKGRGDVMIRLLTLNGGVSATEAVFDKDPDIVVGQTCNDHPTPLQLAIKHDLRDAVEFLWCRCSNVRSDKQQAKVAFYEAAEYGRAECLEILLSCTPPTPPFLYPTANKSTINGMLRSAALFANSVRVVQIFLAAGGSCTSLTEPTHMHSNGSSAALHFACVMFGRLGEEESRRAIVRELLHAPGGMSVLDVQDSLGYTPLALAALHGSAGCVDELLRAGAQVIGVRDSIRGRTPLHLAVCSASVNGTESRCRILRELLAAPDGLSVLDALDRGGNAALHRAAMNGQAGCCEILLEAGSQSLHVRNRQGFTPFQLACRKSVDPEVQEVLLRYGAFPEYCDECSDSDDDWC